MLKIGIPCADLDRRLDVPTILALCGDAPMPEGAKGYCAMGVDTGKDLHAVILRGDDADWEKHHLVHAGVYQDFSELDALITRFGVVRCVIDGLPETHATREFARKHGGLVAMNFFNENQRGAAKWDDEALTVQINRTEALDASRAVVREKKLVLPRQTPIIEEFARHMAADAKILDEDEETGAKKYRYIRTGADHFSLAFTYAWMAAAVDASLRAFFMSLRQRRETHYRDNPAFRPAFSTTPAPTMAVRSNLCKGRVGSGNHP